MRDVAGAHEIVGASVPASAGVAVRVQAVTKTFSRIAAVDDVTLDIPSGRFLSVLGPSGSGKSTLLSCVAGFAFPDRGRIVIGERDVTAVPANRRGLGMVFQRYALFPHMTAAENVAFPLRARGVGRRETKDRVARILALVGLEGLGARRPSQLSGGQRQRVALARALVFEPPVLLLDEPLSALDKALRAAMQVELKALQERMGVTVLFVTHDQEEALALGDLVAVMNEGRLLQIDTPKRVFTAPCDAFVAGFVGESNKIPVTLTSVSGGQGLGEAEGVKLSGRLGDGFLPAVKANALWFLRPEHLVVSTGSAEGGLQGAELRGTVERVVYTGASFATFVRVGAHVFKSRCAAAEGAPEVGDPVTLQWRVGDALFFEDVV